MSAAAAIPQKHFSVSLLLASVPSVSNVSIFQDETIAEPDAATKRLKTNCN
jgi:hypothetical protein